MQLVPPFVDFTKARCKNADLSSLFMHRLRKVSADRAHLSGRQEGYNVLGDVEYPCFLHGGSDFWFERTPKVRNFRPKSKQNR